MRIRREWRRAARGQAAEPQPRFGRIIGIETLLLAVLTLGITLSVPAPASAIVPADFTDTLVANVSAPTDITFTPGGRLVVASQNGVLSMQISGTMTPILDLSADVCADFERGLLGVAFDPDFSTTRHIFVYYTYKKHGVCVANSSQSPVNRVSRFTMSGNTVIRSSETVLIDNMPSPNGNHNAGDIAFGKDGLLYVAIGDGGCELGSPTECAGQNDAARRTNVLLGKILRITKSGGIPSTNPYLGSDSERCGEPGGDGQTTLTHCQETFAWGLRNPFKLAFDPNASGTRFYINDVGQSAWEEVNNGIAGADYGWNCREGFVENGSAPCDNAGGPRVDPIHAYSHGSGCRSITGGAFVPDNVWPAAYNGDYLFADYVCGRIFRLDGSNVVEFASDLGPVTSLEFGPFGNTRALYYAGYNNQVRRIAYTGAVNRPPVARAVANPAFGATPLAVELDGQASSDPDGDALTYSWNFDDDSPAAPGAVVQHTFTANGVYDVELTVSDGRGGSNTTTVKVDAGNTPPEASILAPSSASLFSVGEVITLRGSATDGQEGELPSTALSWSVRLRHDDHEHPYFSGTGNNLTFVAPAPEDLLAAGNSYLIIELTATDGSGLVTTVTQNLMPRTVNVTVSSDPGGAQLFIEGVSRMAGATVLTWAGNSLDLFAPDQVLPNGEAIAFASWSVAGGPSLSFVAPATDTTVTASFTTLSGARFSPVADARVREDRPSRNEGSSTGLTTRGGTSSDFQSFLRFDVSGLGGTVVSATLFLYAYEGTVDGPTVYPTSGSWTESGITWRNKPRSSGRLLDNAPEVPRRSWFALDVTGAVSGNGVVNLLLRSSSTDVISFYSREASSRRPLLVVVTNAAGDVAPPATPAGLTGDAPDSRTVALAWQPSTDDLGIAGYDILRDGVLIGTTSSTGYVDATVSPSRTYGYQVRVRDTSGNRSPLTATIQVRTPAPTATFVVTPTDDAQVSKANPTRNYGRSTQLRAEGGSDPDIESYLRFQLPALPGEVYRATLRVFVPAGSGNGTADGPAVYVAGSSWTELSVTWNQRPGKSTVVADVGAVAAGAWVEYDVTAAIAGGNTRRAFALVSTSTDVVVFSSKEGAAPPQLVMVAYTGGGASAAEAIPEPESPSPAPTAAATPTPEPSPAAGTLPIVDGFESGDLAGWTEINGLRADGSVARNGAWSAVAVSEGAPAAGRRALPEAVGELYARVEVNPLARGSHPFDLFTFMDERGRAMVTLLIETDGDLAVRNDRTGRVTEIRPFPDGRWTTLQARLRADGRESRIEVWVDGDLVHRGRISLRSVEIAAVQLGDGGAGKRFAVAFDDFALDHACIGSCPDVLVTPGPAPEPTREPDPAATPAPDLTATPAPTGEPVSEPTPEPAAEPQPEPAATPESTAEPSVEPEDPPAES